MGLIGLNQPVALFHYHFCGVLNPFDLRMQIMSFVGFASVLKGTNLVTDQLPGSRVFHLFHLNSVCLQAFNHIGTLSANYVIIGNAHRICGNVGFVIRNQFVVRTIFVVLQSFALGNRTLDISVLIALKANRIHLICYPVIVAVKILFLFPFFRCSSGCLNPLGILLRPFHQSLNKHERGLHPLRKGFQHVCFRRKGNGIHQGGITHRVARQIIKGNNSFLRHIVFQVHIGNQVETFCGGIVFQKGNEFLVGEIAQNRCHALPDGSNVGHGVLVIGAVRHMGIEKNIRFQRVVDCCKGEHVPGIHFNEIAVQVEVLRISPETVFFRSVLVGAATSRAVHHSTDIVGRNNGDHRHSRCMLSFGDPFLDPEQAGVHSVWFAGMNGVVDQYRGGRTRFFHAQRRILCPVNQTQVDRESVIGVAHVVQFNFFVLCGEFLVNRHQFGIGGGLISVVLRANYATETKYNKQKENFCVHHFYVRG